MLNLCLREKMKKVFVIMTTAGITLVNAGCVSGCEKQNDDDFMQPGGYSSDVDSTTPKKEDDYADVKIYSTDKRNEKFDESSNIVKETTTTSIGEGVLATNPYTKSNVVVTIANDVKNYNTVTDVVYATTKPVTKATTKVTLKTTKATTKATTTTTTTTVPVTEPPVVETEPPVVEPELAPVGEYTIAGYTIEDAMNSSYSFVLFRSSFRGALMKSDGGLLHIMMPYGDTFCGNETGWVFSAINHNYLSEDIYSDFGKNVEKDAEDFKTFIYNFGYVQSVTGNDIDFSKYTCSDEVGQLLNEAQKAYREGYMDDFLYDKFVNGNISDECRNNPGVMGILCSYDTNHSYLNEDDVSNNYLNGFINHVYESTCGYSYSNSK